MTHYRHRHRFAKRDSNHNAIVKALRAVGCKVIDLSHVGDGVPDLLIAFRQQLLLLELKTERGTLTPAQVGFHREWEGLPVAVVRSIEEAVALVGAFE